MCVQLCTISITSRLSTDLRMRRRKQFCDGERKLSFWQRAGSKCEAVSEWVWRSVWKLGMGERERSPSGGGGAGSCVNELQVRVCTHTHTHTHTGEQGRKYTRCQLKSRPDSNDPALRALGGIIVWPADFKTLLNRFWNPSFTTHNGRSTGET